MGSEKITVLITAEAAEQLTELPEVIIKRIRNLVSRLEKWPAVSGLKRLKGNLSGKYRMRTGDYRLQFRIEEKSVIVIERIGHRGGFYDE